MKLGFVSDSLGGMGFAAMLDHAVRMGVSGVPCFIVESRFAIVGAQDPAVMARALQEIAAKKAAGTLDEPAQ